VLDVPPLPVVLCPPLPEVDGPPPLDVVCPLLPPVDPDVTVVPVVPDVAGDDESEHAAAAAKQTQKMTETKGLRMGDS
jgi:hypothetical protein